MSINRFAGTLRREEAAARRTSALARDLGWWWWRNRSDGYDAGPNECDARHQR